MNIALFASGKGTNVENILKYFAVNKKVNIVLIGTNNIKSGAIQHAKTFKTPYLIFQKQDLLHPQKLIDRLNGDNIELLILAGFNALCISNCILVVQGITSIFSFRNSLTIP